MSVITSKVPRIGGRIVVPTYPKKAWESAAPQPTPKPTPQAAGRPAPGRPVGVRPFPWAWVLMISFQVVSNRGASAFPPAILLTVLIGVPLVLGVLFVSRRWVARTKRSDVALSSGSGPWSNAAWEPKGPTLRPPGIALPLLVVGGALLIYFALRGVTWHIAWWLLLDAVLVFLTVRELRRIFQAGRMGDAHLTFTRFPYFVGERCEMTFGMGPGGATFEDVEIRLRCIAPRDALTRVLHEETYILRADQDPPGPDTFMEFGFDIAPEAWGTELDSIPRVHWEVWIEGRTNRGKFAGRFLIPIYERRSKEA